MRGLLLVIAAVVVLVGGPVPAMAARSLALIIGNDAFAELPPLAKARSDAQGSADFFGARGFEVQVHLDLPARAMGAVLATFHHRIEPGETVVFADAGHGRSDGRENFLVPADSRATGSQTLLAVESGALRDGVNGVLDQTAARASGRTVAVIDACRNNPFTLAQGTRSVGLARGLAPVAGQVVREEWRGFQTGGSVAALEALALRHAGTPDELLARERIARLAPQGAAAAPAPEPAAPAPAPAASGQPTPAPGTAPAAAPATPTDLEDGLPARALPVARRWIETSRIATAEDLTACGNDAGCRAAAARHGGPGSCSVLSAGLRDPEVLMGPWDLSLQGPGARAQTGRVAVRHVSDDGQPNGPAGLGRVFGWHTLVPDATGATLTIRWADAAPTVIRLAPDARPEDVQATGPEAACRTTVRRG